MEEPKNRLFPFRLLWRDCGLAPRKLIPRRLAEKLRNPTFASHGLNPSDHLDG
jgi:hypothetical protein